MKKIYLAGLLLTLCLCLCSCKSSDYKKAMEQFEAGEYLEAKEMFSALADYEDSLEMVKKCDYRMATEQFDAGEYPQAKEAFSTLADYEDSPEMVKKCDYQMAMERMKERQYEDALARFQALGDYEDCVEQSVSCACALSEAYAENGRLKEAVAVLTGYYQYPQAKDVFCTLLLNEASNNYLPNVEQAEESWNEYLLIWLKAVKAASDKTAVGAAIDIPKVDQSAPQVIALKRSMEKANKSIALLREAYSEEVLQICEEDIQNLANTLFESAEVIEKQFENLDNWAVATLFYGIQDNNAGKANNTLVKALYNIEDALEAVMDNRE